MAMTDFDEKRIDQIGQNGNDGLHYSLADNFEIVSRMYDFIWVHKTKPCWIVEYAKFYEAYKVNGTPKKHHNIWANDNSRLSDGDGYKTLEDAMKAVGDLA